MFLDKLEAGHSGSGPTTVEEKILQSAIDHLTTSNATELASIATHLTEKQFGQLLDGEQSLGANARKGQIDNLVTSIGAMDSGQINSGVASFLHATAEAGVLQSHLTTLEAHSGNKPTTLEEKTLQKALDEITGKAADELTYAATRLPGDALAELVDPTHKLDANATSADYDKAAQQTEKQAVMSDPSDSHLMRGAPEIAAYLQGASNAAVLQSELVTEMAHSQRGSLTAEEKIMQSAIEQVSERNADKLGDLASSLSGQQLTEVFTAEHTLGAHATGMELKAAAGKIVDDESRLAAGDIGSHLQSSLNVAVLEKELGALETGNANHGQTAEEKTIQTAIDQAVNSNGEFLGGNSLSGTQLKDFVKAEETLGVDSTDTEVRKVAAAIEVDRGGAGSGESSFVDPKTWNRINNVEDVTTGKIV